VLSMEDGQPHGVSLRAYSMVSPFTNKIKLYAMKIHRLIILIITSPLSEVYSSPGLGLESDSSLVFWDLESWI